MIFCHKIAREIFREVDSTTASRFDLRWPLDEGASPRPLQLSNQPDTVASGSSSRGRLSHHFCSAGPEVVPEIPPYRFFFANLLTFSPSSYNTLTLTFFNGQSSAQTSLHFFFSTCMQKNVHSSPLKISLTKRWRWCNVGKLLSIDKWNFPGPSIYLVTYSIVVILY